MSDQPILTSKQLQGVASPSHPQQQGLFDTSAMVRPPREAPDASSAWHPHTSAAWEHEETNGTPLKMLMTANEVREEYRPHENVPAMKIRESDRWGLRDSVKESGVRYPIHLSEGINDKDYGAQRINRAQFLAVQVHRRPVISRDKEYRRFQVALPVKTLLEILRGALG